MYERGGTSALARGVAAVIALMAATTSFAWGWSPNSGHATVTRASVMSLDERDLVMFGTETNGFSRR